MACLADVCPLVINTVEYHSTNSLGSIQFSLAYLELMNYMAYSKVNPSTRVLLSETNYILSSLKAEIHNPHHSINGQWIRPATAVCAIILSDVSQETVYYMACNSTLVIRECDLISNDHPNDVRFLSCLMSAICLAVHTLRRIRDHTSNVRIFSSLNDIVLDELRPLYPSFVAQAITLQHVSLNYSVRSVQGGVSDV
jgi:hypothetical protein